jgi:ribosomal-protein-alanine N-acetyltransferase
MNTTLETARLMLRPLAAGDLPAVVPLLDDYDVAKNLTHVPHPYSQKLAEEWLAVTEAKRRAREGFTWSVYRGGTFAGICSIGRQHGRFNLGYWYGRPFWGQGYATEAGVRAVRFAFEELGETALDSGWYEDNPASGRVLEKLGFEPAGFELIRSQARNAMVVCNRVWLTAETFLQKKAA